jgi:adenylate cyclase
LGDAVADIFVSYARADKARVAPLVAALEAQGWSVWWDPEITPGQEFDSQIAAALDAAKAVVVVWTPASVDSRWVRGEAREAAERGILAPVRFEAARLPIDFRALHTTDLDDWREDVCSRCFEDLARALKAHIGGASPTAPAAPAAARRSLSICVLPFANMSGDAEQEYFADGISEDIITDLSKVSALSVTSRNTAFSFKGRHVELRQVARQLGVGHLLEGSVRKAGNRVRITAQLIDGASDDHIWAERYDRDLDDIFALQDEIAQAIVAALKLKLLPEEKKAIGERGTENPEAYDLCLRARALAGQFSRDSVKRSTDLLRKAIDLDPGFFPAYLQLISALENYRLAAPERDREIRADQRAVEDRAAEIAPDDPGVVSIRVQRLVRGGDFWEAERLVEQLPSDPQADVFWQSREIFPLSVGRFEEALPWLRETVRRDPLDRVKGWVFRDVLDITGRFDEAEAETERSKDSPGDRAWIELCACFRLKGRADHSQIEARYRVFMAARMSGMWTSPMYERLAAVLSEPEAARAIICEALDDPYFQNPTRMIWLSVFAGFFDAIDEVLEAVRRAYVAEDVPLYLGRYLWMPVLGAARRDPRFKQIVRDLGLVDYWRRSGKWGDFARPVGDDDFEIYR